MLFISLELDSDDDFLLTYEDGVGQVYLKFVGVAETMDSAFDKLLRILSRVKVTSKSIYTNENKMKAMRVVIEQLKRAIRSHDTYCSAGGNWGGEYEILDSNNKEFIPIL